MIIIINNTIKNIIKYLIIFFFIDNNIMLNLNNTIKKKINKLIELKFENDNLAIHDGLSITKENFINIIKNKLNEYKNMPKMQESVLDQMILTVLNKPQKIENFQNTFFNKLWKELDIADGDGGIKKIYKNFRTGEEISNVDPRPNIVCTMGYDTALRTQPKWTSKKKINGYYEYVKKGDKHCGKLTAADVPYLQMNKSYIPLTGTTNNRLIQSCDYIDDISNCSESKIYKIIKPEWQNNKNVNKCTKCKKEFRFYRRKHHCRGNGKIYCNDCTKKKLKSRRIPWKFNKNKNINNYNNIRVCNNCYNIFSKII